MIYGYIRVSTGKQTLENQRLEIRRYCRFHRLRNIVFVQETVSGTKNPEKRKLGSLIKTAQEGDIVVIAEISRLGRSLMMILNVLQLFLEKGVQVRAIKEGYELGDNIQSKVLAFAFGLSAEIERNLISERTKSGLLRAVKEGKKLGRPKGKKPSRYKLTGKGGIIRRARAEGESKSEIARKLGVTWYIDPPYVGADQGHYDGYTQDDFDSLLALLEEIRGKFLLSSYRNKSLNDRIASHGWHTAEIRMHCSMTSRASHVHSKVEVLTANFPFDLNLDGTHKKLVTGAE